MTFRHFEDMIQVTRFTKPLSATLNRVVKLEALPLKGVIGAFALANVKNEIIYMTGGYSSGKLSPKVNAFNLKSLSWHKAPLPPDLNVPRFTHGSCAVGNQVFVVGGFSNKLSLDSIEVLDLKAENQ